jgi:hypothetical protein
LLDHIFISIKENENSNEGTVKAKSKKLGVKLPRGSIYVGKPVWSLFFLSCVIDLIPTFHFILSFRETVGAEDAQFGVLY